VTGFPHASQRVIQPIFIIVTDVYAQKLMAKSCSHIKIGLSSENVHEKAHAILLCSQFQLLEIITIYLKLTK